MSTKEQAAKEAATAHSNLNTWAAVIALLESGCLSGPSAHYYRAQEQVIKIAKAQIQRDLKRYDKALAKARAA